jgi:hypothetical protein
MQVYLVSKTEQIENIVTADSTTGSIANFDPAEMLNDYINFDPSYLSIIRAVGNREDPDEKHPDQYPSGEGSLSNYLGTNRIPSFLFKSTNPYFGFYGIDGNTIDGVPTGENWAKGNAGGGGAVTYIDGGPDTFFAQYWNETDSFNYIGNDVLVGIDTSNYLYTPSTRLNMMSGIISTEDFEIIIYNDLSENTVVNFDNADLDIIANSQTSVSSTTLEMATGAGVGNVGFKYFDCARKEIAYIKWIATDPDKPEVKEHFDIYQINNGPINFNYKPMLLDVKKVETDADAHWGTDNDSWVSPDVVEISSWGDYEDNLISNKYKENDANIGGFLPNHPTRSSG